MSNEPAGPCGHTWGTTPSGAPNYDLHCYWHQDAKWHTGYAGCPGPCGNELIRFDSTYPEQPDGTHYPPQCNQTAGLPPGSLVIDDVPDGTPSPRCAGPSHSAGSFSFSFPPVSPTSTSPTTYPAKIDLHQLGGGNGGHQWFAHAHLPADYGGAFRVTGTWTLRQSINGWARVMVHTPDHAAQARQAKYILNDTLNSKRVVQQRTQANKWVSLGVFQFNAAPQVTLSNDALDRDPTDVASEDVAWDAVAVEPLPAKPRDVVVSMGDSYSSGEGASANGGDSDYYRESNVDGDKEAKDNGHSAAWRDACHRSQQAWSRKATLAGRSATIGQQADSFDDSLDYHLIACSGARTKNILSANDQYVDFDGPDGKKGISENGEVAQIDEGYLDANTTLVTLSIGGNDARFSDIVKACIMFGVLPTADCQDTPLGNDTEPLKVAEPKLIQTKVHDAIRRVLNAIHDHAPNAQIVLMGYPQLFDNHGQCLAPFNSFNGSPAEADWMNQMGDVMTQSMADAADPSKNGGLPTTFSDPNSYFTGQRICGNPETIWGVTRQMTKSDSGPTSSQSFHPKVSGTDHYRDALNNTLRLIGM